MEQYRRKMIKNKISLLAFIWAGLLFFLNLFYKFEGNYNVIIFWILIIIIIGIILYQIFYLEYNSIIVLFEILILSLFLFLTYQTGYLGLRGSDSYVDYNFFKNILYTHSYSPIADDTETIEDLVSAWPMLHFLSCGLTFLTKIDPLIIAKFLPSYISLIIIFPLFLLVKKIYKSEKAALFSCLIYITIPTFMRIHSGFIRETYALSILIFLFFAIYKSKQEGDYRLMFLSTMFIPTIILGHHLTSMMMIVLFFIYFISAKITPIFYKKDLSGRFNFVNILLITSIASFSYWIYEELFVLRTFSTLIRQFVGEINLASYSEHAGGLGTSIVTLKGNILYYGFFLFHFLFALILIIAIIFLRNNKQKIEDFSFSMFLFFCGFYGFLSLYLIMGGAFPQRFLSFGWLFGIIPLAGLLIRIKKQSFRKILVILLVSFIVYNIYNINENYIEKKTYLTGECAGVEEYLVANTIKFPNTLKKYYGDLPTIGAFYDVQGIEPVTVGTNIMKIEDYNNLSTIAIIREELFTHQIELVRAKNYEDYVKFMKIISFKNNINVDKICDLGRIYVLKGD